MGKIRLERAFVALSIFLLVFCFSTIFNTSLFALAINQNVTTSEELFSILDNLKNNEIDENTTIIIDSENTLDYSGFAHVPINFSNSNYSGKGLSVIFNTSVTNVYHKTLKKYIHDTTHYGLFSNVDIGFIPVSYKVNLDAGEGVLSSNLTHYTFGTLTTLPTVTAPSGKNFIKWIEVGDESKTPVTQISESEWGIKSFVAVYEDTENGEDDFSANTYQIIYSDELNVNASLNTTYTPGENLILPSLEKPGFNFIGWRTSGNDIINSIPSSLPDNYVSQDGKIYLNAVWVLKNLDLVTLTNINKIYDGEESSITPDVSHQLIDELSLSYVWYIAYTEDEKSSPNIFSGESKLSFLLPTSAYYKVCIKATHVASGIESNSLESEWIEVNISPKEISLNKLSSTTISKIYDGTKEINCELKSGIDFIVDGIISNDDVNINYEYESKDVGNAKVILTATLNNSNYVFSGNNSIEFDGIIEKREIIPKKVSSPKITKVYDGTRNVNYNFTLNVDYVLENSLPNEEITAKTYSQYDSLNVDASGVILLFDSLIFSESALSENYSFKNSYYDLYFNADITPFVINLGDINFNKIYGDEDSLSRVISTGISNENLNVEYLRESGEIVGRYAITGVKNVSTNPNYLVNFVGSGFLIIDKRIPSLSFPTFKEIDYNPSNTLLSLELENNDFTFDNGSYKHNLGVFTWDNISLVPSVNNALGYSLTFTPNDITNYDYSSFDGYNSNNNTITRKVILSVLPINPVSTPIDESFLVAIGRRFSSITLPNGWSINEDVIPSSSIICGSVGESKTFVNALIYDHDGSSNYNKIYKDLNINLILPKIIYSLNSQTISSGSQTEVIITPNNTSCVKIKLENPFIKEGYTVDYWKIGNDITLSTSDSQISEGSIYNLTDESLIANEITISITLKARNDIKVTFRHYYENLASSFSENYDLLVERNNGTADAIYNISDIDLIEEDGFYFAYAKLLNSDANIENFVVSPSGNSVVNLYYKRKNVKVNYIDTFYSHLNPEGTLPSEKTVLFGIPFTLDLPSNYQLYGYSFIGYTDGITYEDEELKVFTQDSYVINNYVENITFNVVFRPNDNTIEIDKNLGLQNMTVCFGEKVILPTEPTIIPEGKRFTGWMIDGVVYMGGTEFTMPNKNVKIEALFEEIPLEQNSTNEEDKEVDLGLIIGSSVGSVVALAGIVVAIVFVIKKRRKKVTDNDDTTIINL